MKADAQNAALLFSWAFDMSLKIIISIFFLQGEIRQMHTEIYDVIGLMKRKKILIVIILFYLILSMLIGKCDCERS